MRSIEAVRAARNEQGEKAAKDNLTPYVLSDADEVSRLPGGDNWDGQSSFPFPSIGTYVPDGWVDVNEHFFVDATGVGKDHQPALTHQQFNRELMKVIEDDPHLGIAISEIGQWQMLISLYELEDQLVSSEVF